MINLTLIYNNFDKNFIGNFNENLKKKHYDHNN